MTNQRTIRVADVAVQVADAVCPCGKRLTLVALPGAAFRHEDVACGGCVTAVRAPERRKEAA